MLLRPAWGCLDWVQQHREGPRKNDAHGFLPAAPLFETHTKTGDDGDGSLLPLGRRLRHGPHPRGRHSRVAAHGSNLPHHSLPTEEKSLSPRRATRGDSRISTWDHGTTGSLLPPGRKRTSPPPQRKKSQTSVRRCPTKKPVVGGTEIRSRTGIPASEKPGRGDDARARPRRAHCGRERSDPLRDCFSRSPELRLLRNDDASSSTQPSHREETSCGAAARFDDSSPRAREEACCGRDEDSTPRK